MKVKNEPPAVYRVVPDRTAATDDAIIEQALAILESRIRTGGDLLSSPGEVRDWLRLNLAALSYEVFGVLWLDNQNRLIEYDELFRGTLAQTSVYPREVVKQALARNAKPLSFAERGLI